MMEMHAIIWFHGGGLEAGEKHFPKEFLEQGYAVIAVEPDKGGKSFFISRIMEVELTTLQLITVLFAGMKIGNVLLRTVVVVRCLILAIT